MKRIVCSLLLLSALFMTEKIQAQDFKFGYLAVDQVMVLMPEMEGVRSEMTDYENQLTSQIQVKTDNLQTKLADYQKLAENLNAETRLERERELESLNTDLQKFRIDAQQAVAQKEAKLLQPVYIKVQEAIDAVAKANGFTQIFRAETMLYNANAEDIFNLVAKELSLEVPEKPTEDN